MPRNGRWSGMASASVTPNRRLSVAAGFGDRPESPLEELRWRYHLVDLLGSALSRLLAARGDQAGLLHLAQNLNGPGPGPPHPAEQSLVRGAGPTQRLQLDGQHVGRPPQGSQGLLALGGSRGERR